MAIEADVARTVHPPCLIPDGMLLSPKSKIFIGQIADRCALKDREFDVINRCPPFNAVRKAAPTAVLWVGA